MARLRIAFPWLLFAAMAVLVVWSNLRGSGLPDGGTEAGAGVEGRQLDPVCGMEVNPAWGFASTHEGTAYQFCTKRCQRSFEKGPEAYLVDRCMVCRKALAAGEGLPSTYLGHTYLLCSQAHRAAFKAEPASYFMHRMWGIPDWLYYLSIALVLLVSFLMFEGASAFRRLRDPGGASSPGERRGTPAIRPFAMLASTLGLGRTGATAGAVSLPLVGVAAPARPRKGGAGDRFDLLSVPLLRRALLSRPFRFALQLAMVGAFLLIIAAGLFGNQNPALNIAPLLTWTVWWCGLVVLILFAGKAWCYVCPWDALAFWTEKLRFWKKTDLGLGLGMKWPRALRNIWLATFFFVGLTWIELGFGVTMRPRVTAWLALGMLALALVSAFLYERKSFCRYGCLIGRVSGLYALFAGMEVRSREPAVCASCRTKECSRGTESAYGCPTFLYPGGLRSNTYCIQCAECLQACPHDNLAVNLRPWGADLTGRGEHRSDEAYLALLMLAISGFHGLTMTPLWADLTGALEGSLSLGRIAAFSAGMMVLMALPIMVYAALVGLSRRIALRTDAAGDRSSYREYFIRYAYCVLPIALFYHLAHNLEHLLMEGPKALRLASDPFGWGWNLLGTASWSVPPMVSLDVLWVLQVVLVGVGHVYSLWAARNISRQIFPDPAAASRAQWPMLAGMIAFSIFSLWLLKLPMEMRTSAM